jgi:transcriptional regulator with XRE-family HTH domain
MPRDVRKQAIPFLLTGTATGRYLVGMGLAQNVRSRRLALGWTRTKLMQLAGTTSIKPIEMGRIRSPREPTLLAIAKALGATVAELYADPRPARKRRAAGVHP